MTPWFQNGFSGRCFTCLMFALGVGFATPIFYAPLPALITWTKT
jgi:hypothetical protein